MKAKEYIPDAVETEHGDKYGKFFLPISACPICQKLMLGLRHGTTKDIDERFTGPWDIGIGHQLKRMGGVSGSGIEDKDGDRICQECANAGRATFVCALCKTERSSADEQESFGDPLEQLYKVCYETVPAKKWDEEVEKLREVHQYDFE